MSLNSFPPFLYKNSRRFKVKDSESKEDERSKKQYPLKELETMSVFTVYSPYTGGQDRQNSCEGNFQSQLCLNVSTNDGLNPWSVPVPF